MPRRMSRPALADAAVLAIFLGLLAGCAHVPAPIRPRPGYERRIDELASIDATGLVGKRVALDPGHGGVFRGALGVHGLSEAEVNLGVALELRTLLAQRGAIVFMTRETDRDFLTPADSSLKADLTERVRLANDFHPDLFLSIHHNADARGAHDVNETQTYYKLGDDGPSLDAAGDLHRYLVRNLSIERHRIMPGNYFVLRNCESPALLTESSYITNPDVEARLVLDEKRRLEAEALFLGLARYFGRHVPVVDTVWVYAPGYARTRTELLSSQPVIAARVNGTFDGVRMTVDGRDVEPSRTGDSVSWIPPTPLPVGPHVVTFSARLSTSGQSRTRVTQFAILNSVDRVVADFPDQVLWTGTQPLGMRIRVLDGDGLIYRDTVRVHIRDVGTIRVSPADTQLVLPRGEGWVYFRVRSWPPIRGRHPMPYLRIQARSWPPLAGETAEALVEGATVSLATHSPPGPRFPTTRTGFARLMPADTTLRNAPGTSGDDPPLRWINSDGFVCLPRNEGGAVSVPNLPGYRPWPTERDAILAPRDSSEHQGFVPVPATAADWPPRFVAICGGALHGRRITIDPQGGGDESAGEGVSGARAATLNLEVSRALTGFLAAAGAEVKLTREGDYAISDVERVQISEAFHADRFLRIGHAPEPPMIGYYFSSAGGRAWALHAKAAFDSAGMPPLPMAEDAQYPLQQTSCPALFVSPARVDAPASEERLLKPGTLRAEAYALYLSLAREWAPAVAWPADSIEVRDGAGQPVAGVPVTLGGALVLETDALGRVRFARTESGPMMISASIGAQSVRRLLLESERGVILSTGSTGH